MTFTWGKLVKSKCSPQKQSSDFCFDDVRANSVLSRHSSQKYLQAWAREELGLANTHIGGVELGNIPFFVDKSFGFENPYFQRVFSAANVFLVRLDGFSQAAECWHVWGKTAGITNNYETTSYHYSYTQYYYTNLYTHLSRSSAVRHEKYRVLPAGNVTWKQFSRPSTDGWSGLISTPPLLKSNDCMMLCDWPDNSDSCDREVLNRGPPGLTLLKKKKYGWTTLKRHLHSQRFDNESIS